MRMVIESVRRCDEKDWNWKKKVKYLQVGI